MRGSRDCSRRGRRHRGGPCQRLRFLLTLQIEVPADVIDNLPADQPPIGGKS